MLNKAYKYLSVITDLNSKLNWTVHDSSIHYVEYFVTYCEHVTVANSLLDSL